MVDNVSFVDEVNTVPKHHSSLPFASTMSSEYDNHNANNNNCFGTLLNNNNNPPTYGTYQQLSPRSAKLYSNGNNTAVSDKGRNRKEKDVSWLTRSATQPNLSSKTTVSSLAAVASASTQSEESVLEAQDTKYRKPVTAQSSMISCPNSYDALPNEISGEYFDARSSFSAPVELLSEFLSALMSRDYANALNLCQSILTYEPQNATALEFYPLLMNKIKQYTADPQSTTDDDADENSDAVDATDDDEEDEEEGRGGGGKKKPTNTKKSKVNNTQQSRHKKSGEAIVNETKIGDQSSGLCPSSTNMSASNSMDFSVSIDSGRDSLFSPNDSDFTLESGDSLYSSTESNLNMIRSGSDSLFSSTETGLTLESVIRSVQNLGIEGQ